MKQRDGLYIVLIVLLLAFGLYQFSQKKQVLREQNNTIAFLEDSVSYYKDQHGKVVATKTSLAGDKTQLQVLLSKQIDSTQELKSLVKKYKNVTTAGIVQTKTEIDSTFIPFSKPVKCDFFRAFSFDKDLINISGFANEDGVNINSFSSKAKISFAIGERKNGWFKPNTYAIDAKTDNPNVFIEGLDAYQYKPKKKPFGIGPYIGYDPFTKQWSSGLSLQYTIIKF